MTHQQPKHVAMTMTKNDQKWFLSKVKQAIRNYHMIAPGDHVAVALSGGKDSMALLWLLRYLQQYSHLQFQLTAVHIDCQWPGQQLEGMTQFCQQLGVPFVLEQTCIAQAVLPDGNPIDNPCALCSRLRRGALLQWAERQGCNKLALGHHLDDFVETFFLNLFQGGHCHTFAPAISYGDRGITILRPLVYLPEATCSQLAQRYRLPIIKNSCPVDHQTSRADIKALVAQLSTQVPDVRQKVLHALEHDQPDQLWSVYYGSRQEN